MNGHAGSVEPSVAGHRPARGRLSDMVGRKPVWIAGLALFTLCSGVCGSDLAPASDGRSCLPGARERALVLDQRRDYHRLLRFLTGFQTALLVCAGVAAAGVFTALIRGAETELLRAVSTTRATTQIRK